MGGVGTLTLTRQPLITFTQKKRTKHNKLCVVSNDRYSLLVALEFKLQFLRTAFVRLRGEWNLEHMWTQHNHHQISCRIHSESWNDSFLLLSACVDCHQSHCRCWVNFECTKLISSSRLEINKREKLCCYRARCCGEERRRKMMKKSKFSFGWLPFVDLSLTVANEVGERKEYRHDSPLNVALLARVNFHKLFPTRFVACERDKEPWKKCLNIQWCRTTTTTTKLKLEKTEAWNPPANKLNSFWYKFP